MQFKEGGRAVGPKKPKIQNPNRRPKKGTPTKNEAAEIKSVMHNWRETGGERVEKGTKVSHAVSKNEGGARSKLSLPPNGVEEN